MVAVQWGIGVMVGENVGVFVGVLVRVGVPVGVFVGVKVSVGIGVTSVPHSTSFVDCTGTVVVPPGPSLVIFTWNRPFDGRKSVVRRMEPATLQLPAVVQSVVEKSYLYRAIRKLAGFPSQLQVTARRACSESPDPMVRSMAMLMLYGAGMGVGLAVGVLVGVSVGV